ncbi:MAG: phosphopantetheine-binding protein [Rhodoferax sp.]|uniref:acyl carrier protein n=1 Tax=Rhodoferax sp. TaxID=50421 RepID=UPI002635586C|nr:phosphopantetheine-binding protein [Rhodoferax sp.]MDD5336359.1 phosphopantetheine-binding protein [Rhodoferax sp.]
MKTDRQTLQEAVLSLLRAIAPELDPDALAPEQALRHQVDLDSMDWLNFLVSLHERFGVQVAESDYARLISLNDVLDYLQARLL